jgi:hypothetical protein
VRKTKQQQDRQLDDLLSSAIEKADREVQEKPKKLMSIIISRWDDIQHSIQSGVTYKQLSDGMGLDYGYFMTYVYRARKRMENQAQKKKPIFEKEKQNKKAGQTFELEEIQIDENSAEGRRLAQQKKFNLDNI